MFELSWDEDFYDEIRMEILLSKRIINFLRKLKTKKTSIYMKSIFNAPSKSTSFKENLSLHIFKKNDPASCSSKGFPSHEKVMILLPLKSLGISHLRIHLHVSKCNILAHLKLPWK